MMFYRQQDDNELEDRWYIIPARAIILVIVLALRVIIIAEIIESVMGF